MMLVLDPCSAQTLDSGTNRGSEPMAQACDPQPRTLRISFQSNVGPKPAKVGALLASTSPSKKSDVQLESGALIIIHPLCQSNPNTEMDGQMPTFFDKHSWPRAISFFWHVKRVVQACEGVFGSRARVGTLA